jgi:hypothetical protein
MHWNIRKRVYLPLALIFWLFGSMGSFVLGQELQRLPPALTGAATHLSGDLGSLLTGAGVGKAAPPEKVPSTPTAGTNSPALLNSSASHGATRASHGKSHGKGHAKAKHGKDDDGGKHKGDGKKHEDGGKKGHKGGGKQGDNSSGGSED